MNYQRYRTYIHRNVLFSTPLDPCFS